MMQQYPSNRCCHHLIADPYVDVDVDVDVEVDVNMYAHTREYKPHSNYQGPYFTSRERGVTGRRAQELAAEPGQREEGVRGRFDPQAPGAPRGSEDQLSHTRESQSPTMLGYLGV